MSPQLLQPPRRQTDATRSAERPAVVNLRDVTLHLGGQLVFDRLNLTVRKGERLVIMGMSGSGKSALMKLIAGIYEAESGSLRLFGREVYDEPEALEAARKRLGLVFQYGALVSSLSVRDNLAFPLEELTEKTAAEIDAVVMQKLRFVGLPKTGQLMPHELSGGMQKRIAIARALMMEPELLLLDEPTAGLDPLSTSCIDELMLRLNREAQVTEIAIGHKMEDAFRVGTRVALLKDGKIAVEGSPSAIKQCTEPTMVEFLATLARR